MIVSFDFDQTITLNKWDKENNDYLRDEDGRIVELINPKIAKEIVEHKKKGDTVYVLTSRYAIWREDTENFLKDNNLWGFIDGVHFTNGADKVDKAKKLGIEKHYDDDPHEIYKLKKEGIEAVKVDDDTASSYEKMNRGWRL